MEEIFTVTLDGGPVGNCRVLQEGLYSRYRCRCTLPDGKLRELTVQIGDWERCLGVLVPSAGSYILDTRVAAKQIPEGTPTFSVRLREQKPMTAFVPISPEEPFAYLSRLEAAYLTSRNGETGVSFR